MRLSALKSPHHPWVEVMDSKNSELKDTPRGGSGVLPGVNSVEDPKNSVSRPFCPAPRMNTGVLAKNRRLRFVCEMPEIGSPVNNKRKIRILHITHENNHNSSNGSGILSLRITEMGLRNEVITRVNVTKYPPKKAAGRFRIMR